MFDLRYYMAGAYVAVALLTDCGGSQPPIGAPGAMLQSHAIAQTRSAADHVLPPWSYRVLYGFDNYFDNYVTGALPAAGLVAVNGMLYGTTSYGGQKCSCGTVYRISTAGKLKVLYQFAGGSDGAHPLAGLIDMNGTLYGTTLEGGGSPCYAGQGCGIIYSITTAGVETVLHRFAGGSDGATPVAGLINVNGTLYGTTVYGGSSDKGTVYSITQSGVETIVHSFRGGGAGARPFGGLIDVNGKLYG
ncbi:MAG TPA: choice-of-anchor tandem repeat GloVer-containing protein, partial [Candidatus Cybelea sp.]|nr:choice-of-anchor tandem repeat GloVer-containing protein [Candidatus Cybelea sp.]